MLVINPNAETLERIKKKLSGLAKDLHDRWNLRQNKTKLQEVAQKAFGCIHDTKETDSLANMVEHLEKVILSLPAIQSELFDAQECYPGFLSWNQSWKESYSKDPMKDQLTSLTKVYLCYENQPSKTQAKDHSL